MRYEMTSFFEAPEFKNSLAKYEGMVKDHAPAYFDADELTDIAEYYAAKGRDAEADEAISYGLSIHPDDIDLLIFRARSMAIKGDTKGARQVMSLITDQTDREVRFLEFDILNEEGKYEEADRVLETLAKEENYSMEAMMDILQTYVDNELIHEAKSWYERIDRQFQISELKKQKRLRSILCDYYLTCHLPDSCIPLLEEMIDESPYSMGLWNDLGRCYMEKNDWEKAHEAFDFTLAIDDHNPEALLLKAMCYRFAGNTRESVRYIQRAVDLGLQFPGANLMLMRSYLTLRDFEAALTEGKRILEKRNEVPADLLETLDVYLAVSLAGTDHKEEALECVKRVEYKEQDQTEILLHIGFYYVLAGDINQANNQFYNALNRADDGERYELFTDITGILFDFKEFAAANLYYRTLLRESPEESAPMLYPAMYSFVREQDIFMFYHCFARIRKEEPGLYEQLGHIPGIPDKRFDVLLTHLKQLIVEGKMDVEPYLDLDAMNDPEKEDDDE